MKIFSVKTEHELIEITAYSVTRDLVWPGVIWADGIRIYFEGIVVYVEEL